MTDITELKPISGAKLRAKSRRIIFNPETGNAYLVRKPTFAQVIATGILPANYLGELLRRRREKADDEAQQPADVESGGDTTILEADKLQHAYVVAALLSPRLVENPNGEDECEYDDIPEEDRRFIYLWATGRSTVATGDGEVEAAAVANFPDGEQGSEPSGAGDDGVLHRAEGVAAAEAA